MTEETQLAGFRDGYQDVSEELQKLSQAELAKTLGEYVRNPTACVVRFGGLGPGRSGVLRPVFEARWVDVPRVSAICPNTLTGGRVRRVAEPGRARVEALERDTETVQLWVELIRESG